MQESNQEEMVEGDSPTVENAVQKIHTLEKLTFYLRLEQGTHSMGTLQTPMCVCFIIIFIL